MHHEKIEHKFPPRENQKIAIDEAVEGLQKNAFHGLLLEMSLGKTKVSLNVAEILQCRRILIVYPKGIEDVWLQQIPEHSNFGVEPVIWQNGQTRKFRGEVKAMAERDVQILMVRLELFQRDSPALKEALIGFFQEPTLVILDESSKIKNVTAKRTPRLIEYTRGAVYRLILTGTPWTESPLDIFAQMEFLHEGFWYQFDPPWKVATFRKHWYIFRNRYAIMKEVNLGGGRSFKAMVGTRRTEEIAKKIAPYVTQQKKADWTDLPPKIHQTIHVEMSAAHAAAYKELKERLILEHGEEVLTVSNAAVLTLRLRQVAGGYYPETGEPIDGVPAGIETLLEDVDGYPGKVVVAACFIAEIRGLLAALKDAYGEDRVCEFYGSTEDRPEQLRRFEGSAKFMVLNPQTGGYGLNLQFASLMYLYSRPFSYEQNAQLEDRVHRPGLVGSAVYKDIVHARTVQSKPIQAFNRKKNVADEFSRLTLRQWLEEV